MRFTTDRKWGGADLFTTTLMLGMALVLKARARKQTPQPGVAPRKVPLLSMQIEKASEKEVITTGARYVIHYSPLFATGFNKLKLVDPASLKFPRVTVRPSAIGEITVMCGVNP
jgi:hypothetical protein